MCAQYKWCFLSIFLRAVLSVQTGTNLYQTQEVSLTCGAYMDLTTWDSVYVSDRDKSLFGSIAFFLFNNIINIQDIDGVKHHILIKDESYNIRIIDMTHFLLVVVLNIESIFLLGEDSYNWDEFSYMISYLKNRKQSHNLRIEVV